MARSDRLSQHEHRQRLALAAIAALATTQHRDGEDLQPSFTLIGWITGYEHGVGCLNPSELRELLASARKWISPRADAAVRTYLQELEQ